MIYKQFSGWLENVYIKDDGKKMTANTVRNYVSCLKGLERVTLISDLPNLKVPYLIKLKTMLGGLMLRTAWSERGHQNVTRALDHLLMFKQVAEGCYTRPPYKWTNERILQEASKYNSLSEFARANQSAYNLYRKKPELHQAIRKHMYEVELEKIAWTEQKIIKVACKYDTWSDFEQGNPYVYELAMKKPELVECLDELMTKQTT